MILGIEKDFLKNVDYLNELAYRVKNKRRIDDNLLSEVVCAKCFINSLSSEQYKSNHQISKIADLLDLIIKDSEKSNSNKFKNPCYKKLTISLPFDYEEFELAWRWVKFIFFIFIYMCVVLFSFLVFASFLKGVVL